MTASPIILGIDFGTTFSSAAAIIDGEIALVLDQDEPAIPSVVHIPAHGDALVGRPAMKYAITEPANTIPSVKRLLGRNIDDPEVRLVDAGVGYKIKEGPNKMAVLSIRDRDYAPSQLVALILNRLRSLGEQQLGRRIDKAIMTVPAGSTAEYCNALRQAARFAHLEALDLIAEPIAGALALGLHSEPADRQLAVCDFGGGTFDTTLVVQEGYRFSPIAISADRFLGGDDFDDILADAVAGHVFQKTRYDMHQDVVRWRELVLRCEALKRKLSSAEEAVLSMRDAYTVNGARHNLKLALARAWIEPRWQPLIDRAAVTTNRLLEAGHASVADIDDVALIGGTTMIPMVQRGIGAIFGRPVKTSPYANIAVTVGAALQTRAEDPIAPGAPFMTPGVKTFDD